MKNIKNYINERLHLTSKLQYSCQPTTKKELLKIIIKRIKEDGPECDLNDIDVSKIKNMRNLFDASQYFGTKIFRTFNGDISRWDVSNVRDMYQMFNSCENFNCDLSRWNVSNVEYMQCMFYGCNKFNCDLSRWNVSNVKNIYSMFAHCEQFNCDLSNWNLSKVDDIHNMFYKCKNFRQNLDDWNISKNVNMWDAFTFCPTQPKWYKYRK